LWRLDALDRAYESGCDDVGIGALFGLYDWRFEVLGLVSHARHLMAKFDCGPHTISFPRLRPASGVQLDDRWLVNDGDFKRLVAILRLSVPYTGMILTAREPAHVRQELLGFGVSQIDAGSRIELGGYTEAGDAQQQVCEREQFELGDVRSLDEVVAQLLADGYIPSFCTACYRLGRTGEQFMEFAVPGFIERLCTPNALTTLQEYLVDYASPATRQLGERLIQQNWPRCPTASASRNWNAACSGSSPRRSEICFTERRLTATQRGARVGVPNLLRALPVGSRLNEPVCTTRTLPPLTLSI
jgi:2-iminoacetate synthase